MRYHLTSVRTAVIKKTRDKKINKRMWTKGNVSWDYKKQYGGFSKKIEE
jgi:hypothetical protein